MLCLLIFSLHSIFYKFRHTVAYKFYSNIRKFFNTKLFTVGYPLAINVRTACAEICKCDTFRISVKPKCTSVCLPSEIHNAFINFIAESLVASRAKHTFMRIGLRTKAAEIQMYKTFDIINILMGTSKKS